MGIQRPRGHLLPWLACTWPLTSSTLSFNRPCQPSNTWSPGSCFSSVIMSWKNSFSSVQSLSCVRLFATPWTVARQASLSTTNSRSPPKPMSIELVMPSNHLILCHLLLLLPSIFPNIIFQMSQFFPAGGQSIGVSASALVLPMHTQDWSPLGWTGWISLAATCFQWQAGRWGRNHGWEQGWATVPVNCPGLEAQFIPVTSWVPGSLWIHHLSIR